MGVKEEIMMSGKYSKTESAVNTNKCDEEEDKIYTYDEAIDLTGSGWYNVSLLLALVLVLKGMAMDMFGFGYVVAAARCDLQLSHNQESFLLSVPLIGSGWYNISLLVTLALGIQSMSLDMFGFAYVVSAARCDLDLSHSQVSFLLSVPLTGSVFSAYVHGYLSDMYGRKKCISIALVSSYLIASLSAFSPNFIVLAILKFFSSSVCSGVQSMGYTMIGESCSVRTKEPYVMILTSALMCCLAVFTAHAYIVLGLNFSYDLGFIVFKPWRLLILTLALALGVSAVFIQFFYESPKYLVSAGRVPEALEILRKIRKRNGLSGIYPVKKIVLLDPCSTKPEDVPFLRSLWEQIAPLFKPPLLQKTLLFFYILAALFSLNNGFYIWIPVLFSAIFNEPTADGKNVTENFCNLIKSDHKSDDCNSVVHLETLVMSIIQGVVFFILNFCAARFSHRKKFVVIWLSVIASVCCIGMIFVTEKITTIILFFGVLLHCISMGMIFCYMIELYPTRYRGMITSLGVMVARSSALIGVYLVGAFMFTHCTTSLYVWGAYAFSGGLMALLLPPDLPKKS